MDQWPSSPCPTPLFCSLCSVELVGTVSYTSFRASISIAWFTWLLWSVTHWCRGGVALKSFISSSQLCASCAVSSCFKNAYCSVHDLILACRSSRCCLYLALLSYSGPLDPQQMLWRSTRTTSACTRLGSWNHCKSLMNRVKTLLQCDMSVHTWSALCLTNLNDWQFS